METSNHDQSSDEQQPKGPTPIDESKPVGYGSSIQSDGLGNRTRPQNHEDVNPTTQQDHIQELKNGEETAESDDTSTERIPETNGTGANREVHTDSSLIIEKEDGEE